MLAAVKKSLQSKFIGYSAKHFLGKALNHYNWYDPDGLHINDNCCALMMSLVNFDNKRVNLLNKDTTTPKASLYRMLFSASDSHVSLTDHIAHPKNAFKVIKYDLNKTKLVIDKFMNRYHIAKSDLSNRATTNLDRINKMWDAQRLF